MFYRNMFESNDIYFRYRQQKESFRERIEVQAAGEFLLNEAAVALKEEIQKALNSK